MSPCKWILQWIQQFRISSKNYRHTEMHEPTGIVLITTGEVPSMMASDTVTPTIICHNSIFHWTTKQTNGLTLYYISDTDKNMCHFKNKCEGIESKNILQKNSCVPQAIYEYYMKCLTYHCIAKPEIQCYSSTRLVPQHRLTIPHPVYNCSLFPAIQASSYPEKHIN